MNQIRNEALKSILMELTELLRQIYDCKLKSVVLYGSAARGSENSDSDIDIMVLVDGTDAELSRYSDGLSDVSTDMSLKYCRVFSIIDVSYQEYMRWNTILPFYRNVFREGVVLYAA